MDELIFSSATELARVIQAKEVSSLEVVTAYLERIDAVIRLGDWQQQRHDDDQSGNRIDERADQEQRCIHQQHEHEWIAREFR